MEIIEKLEAEMKELQTKFKKITEEKEVLENVEKELKSERELRRQQEERLKQLLSVKCNLHIIFYIAETLHSILSVLSIEAIISIFTVRKKQINTSFVLIWFWALIYQSWPKHQSFGMSLRQVGWNPQSWGNISIYQPDTKLITF